MLQRKDIARMIGCSVTLLLQWQRQGFLPPPDKANGKPLLWSNKLIYDFCKRKNFVRVHA